MPLAAQARLLGVNRSGLYYRSAPPAGKEAQLRHAIDAIYTAWPFYGSRRIAAELRRQGTLVSRKAVQARMRAMGIAGVCPGPNLSHRRLEHRLYPYLLRGLAITAPNQVWGIDITYIRMRRSWMYLVALIDWHSRLVLAWELSDTLEEGFVLRAVRQALSCGAPTILNSDQGSHFTCPAYVALVEDAGVRISMDGRGRALDNVFTERLWRSVKYEEVYLHEYNSPREVRHGISAYMAFYNTRRVHQALGYRTPAEAHAEGTLEALAGD